MYADVATHKLQVKDQFLLVLNHFGGTHQLIAHDGSVIKCPHGDDYTPSTGSYIGCNTQMRELRAIVEANLIGMLDSIILPDLGVVSMVSEVFFFLLIS